MKPNIEILAAALRKILPHMEHWNASLQPGTDANSDYAFILSQVTVGTKDTDAFHEFIEVLRQDPYFGAFDGGKWGVLPSGGGGTVQLDAVANHLLARLLNEGIQPEAILAQFQERVQNEYREFLFVASILGISVDKPVGLGSGITLMSLDQVPPSIQRGIALNQNHPYSIGQRPMTAPRATAALVIHSNLPTKIVAVSEGYAAQEKIAPHVAKANETIEEVIDLLAAIHCAPAFLHMTWAQPADINYLPDVGSGWHTSDAAHFRHVPPIPFDQSLLDLFHTYLAKTHSDRQKKFRIPMARLNRALSAKAEVDQAIDLGIALESLLLHDIEQPTELSFRLRLRGANLRGGSVDERRSAMAKLNELYDLRSKAVHLGVLKPSKGTDPKTLLKDGMAECSHLIKLLVKSTIEPKNLELMPSQ